ncbi:MAG: hypothetical protein LBP62_03090 [Clostridiales bacterium]|jgi:hypothetical protein|nr:hypothetical protein [Clostridiales bacterium]
MTYGFLYAALIGMLLSTLLIFIPLRLKIEVFFDVLDGRFILSVLLPFKIKKTVLKGAYGDDGFKVFLLKKNGNAKEKKRKEKKKSNGAEKKRGKKEKTERSEKEREKEKTKGGNKESGTERENTETESGKQKTEQYKDETEREKQKAEYSECEKKGGRSKTKYSKNEKERGKQKIEYPEKGKEREKQKAKYYKDGTEKEKIEYSKNEAKGKKQKESNHKEETRRGKKKKISGKMNIPKTIRRLDLKNLYLYVLAGGGDFTADLFIGMLASNFMSYYGRAVESAFNIDGFFANVVTCEKTCCKICVNTYFDLFLYKVFRIFF